jgi:pyridoxal phosphate enzyme (YggS family)
MNIQENIQRFKNILNNENVKLIAVSKTHPAELILEAYSEGVKNFGENKVQEMVDKFEQLPKDINWHMIGHLQRNKVKYIASFVYLIHSVDSERLLQEIDKQGQKVGRVISCLLQVHIAKEETKFGLSEEELFSLLNNPETQQLKHVQIIGLMGMATNTTNGDLVRQEFRYLKNLFEQIKPDYKLDNFTMKELSMGMSSDYTIALEEGSTMVRVGSSIFGNRDYSNQ